MMERDRHVRGVASGPARGGHLFGRGRPRKGCRAKIAASILVLIGVGFTLWLQMPKEYTTTTVVTTKNSDSINQSISFGDLSPELKKVEDYYVANINYELSKLEVSEENKEIDL